MTKSASSPYDWVREISPELKALDDSPLTGAAPSFPWDQLASRLAQSFERENMSIKPEKLEWRSKDELYEGMGDSPFPLNFAIPSLRGNVCWIMPEQDMVILESLLLTKDPHPISFQDRDLSESFYHFLAIEVLYHMSQVEFDKSVTPILTNQRKLPDENSLCLDISIQIQMQTVWGRLIISPELRRSWVEHFAKQSPSILTQQMAQKVDVTLHLEAGKTLLSLEEWQSIELGDLILLDSCSLDLEAEDFSGRVMITLNGKNIFRAKLKDGNVKILELPLYYEVDNHMAKHGRDEDDDDLSDFDEDELSVNEEDEDDLDDEISLTDLEDEDEDFFEEEEDFEEETLTKASPPSREEAPAVPQNANVESSVATKPLGKVGHVALDQIPVSLVIEVGSIQMTMQKLLELEPGNLLELNIHPENGVNLTINGKKVGSGELIRIGESLGVRVLEIGH